MSNLPGPEGLEAGGCAPLPPPIGMLCMRLCGIELCGVESGVVCNGAPAEPLVNGEAPELEPESRLKGEVSPVDVVGDGADANRLAALKLEIGEEDAGAMACAGDPSDALVDAPSAAS
jgi:hypothetical protein